MKLIFKTFLFTFIFLSTVIAQRDTITTTNNQVIAGKIKGLTRGILQIETDYSDEDFLVEWKKVKGIKSQHKFTISLSSGTRLLGTINGLTDSIAIKTKTITLIRELQDIVELDEFEESFFERLSASISIGFNITKSNNLRQFTARSNLGYFSLNWKTDAAFDAVYSIQDSVDQTKRIDAKIAYQYFLWKDWYVSVSSDFLENDEQKLKLRSTPKFGFGNYVIHTNRAYLMLGAGISGNFEQYTDETIEARNESEAFLNTELNMFNYGDLSLLSNATIYKSLEKEKRIRRDFKIDLKYDILGTDFYIKVGYTLNYDSSPVEGAQTTDYIIQTTFGWDL